VRDGEKGPVAIAMVTCRVQTRMEHQRTGPQEWLVVTRRPLTDERTLEPRASRDATDQDEHHRYHDYLTPTGVSDTISVEFSCKIRYALRQKTYVSAPTHDYRRPYDP